MDAYYTMKEQCRLFKCCRECIRRWMMSPGARDAKGNLLGGRNFPKPIKPQGSRAKCLWRKSEVDAWMDGQRT
jgi:predicted DNA-binding transcriptional regulator AlpA